MLKLDADESDPDDEKPPVAPQQSQVQQKSLQTKANAHTTENNVPSAATPNKNAAAADWNAAFLKSISSNAPTNPPPEVIISICLASFIILMIIIIISFLCAIE